MPNIAQTENFFTRYFFTQKSTWFCFFAGFSLVFAYAPFSQWWLALTCPIIFLHFLNGSTAKQARNLGFMFAFGWFASGISWVHVSIDQFGGMPLIVSLLIMLMLCLYLALFSALSCYLTAFFSPLVPAKLTPTQAQSETKASKALNLWLLPPFWLIAEYLRSVILTGFPWLSLGYSQIDGPLAVFAPIIGEVGITALVLLINISLYKMLCYLFFINKPTALKPLSTAKELANKKQLAIAVSVLITITVAQVRLQYIRWVTPNNEKVNVALVQGNIPQTMKWLPEQEWPTLLKYLDLTRENYDADIIIWPESAVPAVEPAVQDYLSNVNRSALLNNSAIITGIINYNFETKEYFNSLITLGAKNNDDNQGYYYNSANRYYKNHLLPIGEFVPFQEWLRPLAPFFNLPMSSFTRGNYIQPNLMANNLHILPLICFEIAFPEQLAANLTAQTDIILTVSNDAWFGDSHGPHQHLEIARMRALEFGRPLLRSTNNGITAVIDHNGKITKRIPQFKEAVLKAKVQLVTGETPYSQWPRLILLLLVVILILVPIITTKLTETKPLNS